MRYKSSMFILLGLFVVAGCSSQTEEPKAKVSVATQAPKPAVSQSTDSIAKHFEFSYVTSEGNLTIGKVQNYTVRLKNASNEEIHKGDFYVSYLWWDGVTAEKGEGRVDVPTILPGADTLIEIPIIPVNRPGKITLKIDLSNDKGIWLSDMAGFQALHYDVLIK